MRLTLHNIGPIRDADIDLSGLTVLVGPNGSGKTTFSAVAYAAALASQKAFFSARRAVLSPLQTRNESAEDALERAVERWEHEFRRGFEMELRRCVSRDLALLGREGRAGKGAAPRIYVTTEDWTLVFRVDRDGLVIERSNKAYRVPTFDVPNLPRSSRDFEQALARKLRFGIPTRSMYFPAARSGFMQTFAALTALVFGALGGGYFEDATVGTI